MYLLIYTFLLSSGMELTAEREAHTQNWRPVRSMEQCRQIASEQEERLLRSIEHGNDLIVDATVECRKVKRKSKRR